MPDPLTPEILRSRLREYPRDGYLYIGSIMKGVSLAAGTLVLLEILADLGVLWPRLVLWLTSVVAVMVTYLTSNKGILLTNSRANLGDSLLPLLVGINEFCLFAVLSPRMVSSSLWRMWLIVLAVHALMGLGLVYNRYRIMKKHGTELENLEDLSKKLIDWAKTGVRNTAWGAATAFAVGSLAIFVLPSWVTGMRYAIVYAALALPFLFILSYIAYDSDRQRQEIDCHAFSDATQQIGHTQRERVS